MSLTTDCPSVLEAPEQLNEILVDFLGDTVQT